MKTILVATDFSDASKNAANYAAEMALLIGADLHLLHVFQLPFVYKEVPVVITDEELIESSKQSIERLKEEIQIKVNYKLAITTEIIKDDFFDALVRVCKRIDPYTVVMGSQGTSAAERFFFGGHAVHTIKYLEYPLITVPPGVQFKAIKKIGFACDFDHVNETVPVEEVEWLVKEFNAELHVLNIGKLGDYDPNLTYEARILKNKLGDLFPQYHFLAHKNIDDGILDFIEKNKIDLLVIIPKMHGIIGALLHKSHSKQLVLHSHVPVMAIHQ